MQKNAKQMPEIFYCKHMVAGVAGYEDENILVSLDTMKKMCKSFIGKPVYVYHVDTVNVEEIEKADGFVTECWYDANDGWLWAKFIAVTDALRSAIDKGWSVSNAYIPTKKGDGGTYTNVPYKWEVLGADFTHLAIVPNPRYESAKIFTEANYKDHVATIAAELQNSKKEKRPMLKLFKTKREEITNAKDLDADTVFELENGQTATLEQMVNALKNAKKNEDEKEEKINMDLQIEVGDEKMPLKDLINKYTNMKKNESEEDKENEDKEEKENKRKNSDEDEEKSNKKHKRNEDEEKDNEDEEEKKNSHPDYFKQLQNAHKSHKAITVDTDTDKLNRGLSRYGSKK